MRRSPTGSFRRATRFSGWDSARRSSACTRSSSAMRSGNRPVTSRSRRGSCSSCWVRSTTSTGTFCSTTRWPSARSTRRAPSSNARSRAVSRRRDRRTPVGQLFVVPQDVPAVCRSPRLRNISRRSGSCVPKSCSIRRSSPSRRSHTGSGSRPRAIFHNSSAKGGVPPQQYRRERRQPGR